MAEVTVWQLTLPLWRHSLGSGPHNPVINNYPLVSLGLSQPLNAADGLQLAGLSPIAPGAYTDQVVLRAMGPDID